MSHRNCSDLQYHLFTVVANMTFSIVMIAALTITALPLSWPAMTMRENLQVIQVFDFVRYFGDVVWDETSLKKLKKNKAQINFLSLYALLPIRQELCTSACVAATIALLHTPISLCMLTVMFKMTVYTVVSFILQQSQNVARTYIFHGVAAAVAIALQPQDAVFAARARYETRRGAAPPSARSNAAIFPRAVFAAGEYAQAYSAPILLARR